MTYTGAALPRRGTAVKIRDTAIAPRNNTCHLTEKRHNFLLRTPFLVILDFSESLFRGLSNFAENKPQDQKVQVVC